MACVTLMHYSPGNALVSVSNNTMSRQNAQFRTPVFTSLARSFAICSAFAFGVSLALFRFAHSLFLLCFAALCSDVRLAYLFAFSTCFVFRLSSRASGVSSSRLYCSYSRIRRCLVTLVSSSLAALLSRICLALMALILRFSSSLRASVNLRPTSLIWVLRFSRTSAGNSLIRNHLLASFSFLLAMTTAGSCSSSHLASPSLVGMGVNFEPVASERAQCVLRPSYGIEASFHTHIALPRLSLKIKPKVPILKANIASMVRK